MIIVSSKGYNFQVSREKKQDSMIAEKKCCQICFRKMIRLETVWYLLSSLILYESWAKSLLTELFYFSSFYPHRFLLHLRCFFCCLLSSISANFLNIFFYIIVSFLFFIMFISCSFFTRNLSKSLFSPCFLALIISLTSLFLSSFMFYIFFSISPAHFLFLTIILHSNFFYFFLGIFLLFKKKKSTLILNTANVSIVIYACVVVVGLIKYVWLKLIDKVCLLNFH